MTVASEFEVANQQYVAGFDKADLPMPPGRYASHMLSRSIIIAIAIIRHSHRQLTFHKHNAEKSLS